MFLRKRQKNNLKNKQTDANALSLDEHMRELRGRLLCIFITFVLGFALCYYFANDILQFLLNLGNEAGFTFVYISPQEILIQQMRLAFTVSLVVSIPVILYEIIVFIAPIFSDYKGYRRVTLLLSTAILLLFITGVIFAYKILLPFTYGFLSDLSSNVTVTAAVSVERYVSLFLTIILCIGVVFELPLICVLLTKLGIISADTLRKCSKLAWIVSLVLGAFITPPDVVSQLVVAVPMMLLYYLSIGLCTLVKRGGHKHGKSEVDSQGVS